MNCHGFRYTSNIRFVNEQLCSRAEKVWMRVEFGTCLIFLLYSQGISFIFMILMIASYSRTILALWMIMYFQMSSSGDLVRNDGAGLGLLADYGQLAQVRRARRADMHNEQWSHRRTTRASRPAAYWPIGRPWPTVRVLQPSLVVVAIILSSCSQNYSLYRSSITRAQEVHEI